MPLGSTKIGRPVYIDLQNGEKQFGRIVAEDFHYKKALCKQTGEHVNSNITVYTFMGNELKGGIFQFNEPNLKEYITLLYTEKNHINKFANNLKPYGGYLPPEKYLPSVKTQHFPNWLLTIIYWIL